MKLAPVLLFTCGALAFALLPQFFGAVVAPELDEVPAPELVESDVGARDGDRLGPARTPQNEVRRRGLTYADDADLWPLRITARSEDGAPLSAKLELRTATHFESLRCDAEGHADCALPTLGPWRYVAHAAGWADCAGTLELGASELQLVFARGRSLRVRTSPAPLLPELEAVHVRAGERLFTGRLEAGGFVQFAGLPCDVPLAVTASGARLVDTPRFVDSGDEDADVELVLALWPEHEVRIVLAEDGRPAPQPRLSTSEGRSVPLAPRAGTPGLFVVQAPVGQPLLLQAGERARIVRCGQGTTLWPLAAPRYLGLRGTAGASARAEFWLEGFNQEGELPAGKRIVVPQGRGFVRLRAPGWHGVAARVPEDGDLWLGPLEVAPSRRVHGRVVGLPSGARCHVVAFAAEDPEQLLAETRCAADGGFAFAALPGAALVLQAIGPRLCSLPQPLDGAAGNSALPLLRVFELREVPVRVRAEVGAGTPVLALAHAQLRATSYAGARRLHVSSARTDPHGRGTLRVAIGADTRLVLEARGRDFEPVLVEHHALLPGRELELRVAAPLQPELQVLAPDGAPAAGALVSFLREAQGEGEPRSSARCDREGRLLPLRLRAGVYTIEITAPGARLELAPRRLDAARPRLGVVQLLPYEETAPTTLPDELPDELRRSLPPAPDRRE